MNFELSDEQTLLAETFKRFVATHYNFDARAKIIASPAGHSEDVWAALAEDRFLILPHPEVAGYYAMRAGDTDKWLRGMNRLQQRIETGGTQ